MNAKHNNSPKTKAARIRTLAKANRKRPTAAEKQLWSILRGRRLAGYKFRRQHPLGSYIPDFVCLEKKLIIELDGGQHARFEQATMDENRTDCLREKGFRIIRFWNADMLKNKEGVVIMILEAINGRKTR